MSLESTLESLYQNFLKRTEAHLNQTHDYRWLTANKTAFHLQPDYLQLHQFAPTPIRKFSNQKLALIPSLWTRTAWPQIVSTILDKLLYKYIFDLERNHPQAYSIPKIAEKDLIRPLEKILSQKSILLPKATFTDLYFFLTEVLRSFCEINHIPKDMYAPTKLAQNKACLSLYNRIRPDILSRDNALDISVFLAIRGNWIDCVENNLDEILHHLPEEINSILDEDRIQTELEFNPFFQLSTLKNKLKKPSKILYELDNSGEVIFDLLLIEILLKNGHEIALSAKEEPVLNDITYTELQDLLTRQSLAHLRPYLNSGQLTLLTTNSPIAGKYLPQVSNAYQNAYKWADFLILKGQGNFHTMPIGKKTKNGFKPHPFAKPKVFMMMVKAPFIAACFNSILSKGPKLTPQQPFLYVFDPQNRRTYPT